MSRFKIAPAKKEIIKDGVDNELLIDDHNLNAELMNQPLYFRKYSKLLSEVQKKASITKLTLEEAESKMYADLSKNGQGLKVRELEAMVALDENIKKLKRELLDADALVQEFEGIVKAFYQRHEMLKDLCANKRKELVD